MQVTEYYDDYVDVPVTEIKPAYRRGGEQEIGCPYCYDRKRKKNITIFFIDKTNSLRDCVFCPYCGRRITDE